MSSKAPARAARDWLTSAAVLSVFDIDWIYPSQELTEAEVDDLTDFLAASCERVIDPAGTPRWRLRDDERARVLRTVPRATLRAALDRVTRRPDDPVQVALSRYVSREATPVHDLDAAGLRGVLQLQRWAGDGSGMLAGEGEIQARLDWLTLTEPLRRLVGRGFFGRQELLSDLRAFVEAANPGGHVFLLEGVGGSGKSSVLARLILDLPVSGDLTAYLSFDRGWLLDGGPRAIFDELVRQVAAQLDSSPDRDQASYIRQALQTGSRRSKGYRDVASRGSQAVEPIDDKLMSMFDDLVGRRHRLVVVLDTLEELARRDWALGQEVFTFLEWQLGQAVRNVRVVAAGRAMPLFAGRSPDRRLAGLDEADALDLMRALTSGTDVTDGALRTIIDLVGGNPLSLHLAADVLNRTGEDPAQVIAVTEGNVQGQLYSRLLEHIRDPQVRAVAHPGLVVRRITPEIISDVLAGPCGLAPLSAADAARIFGALWEEATLCEPSPDGDNALVHRQDVRAIMLPAIRRDRPATTRAIHEAAVRYYAAQPPGTVASREELYHRLMLEQPREVLDSRWNPAADTELATVIDEFPPRAQLYLNTKIRGLRLDPAVRAAADDDEWRQAVRPSALLRMERGQVADALALVQERRDADGHPLLPDVEVEALERLGRAADALDLAERERERAAQRGDADLVRVLITEQARIHERLRQWPRAWDLLSGLAALDRARRERTSALDEEIRIRELVVLTSMLRVARHLGRSDEQIEELRRETALLAESTPQRLLAANSSLLRDLASEVGLASRPVLGLAVSTLAPDSDTAPPVAAAPVPWSAGSHDGDDDHDAPSQDYGAAPDPESSWPETVAPETVAPEIVAPQTVTPETVAPETVAPETLTPEDVAPFTVAAESSQDYLVPEEGPEETA